MHPEKVKLFAGIKAPEEDPVRKKDRSEHIKERRDESQEKTSGEIANEAFDQIEATL